MLLANLRSIHKNKKIFITIVGRSYLSEVNFPVISRQRTLFVDPRVGLPSLFGIYLLAGWTSLRDVLGYFL